MWKNIAIILWFKVKGFIKKNEFNIKLFKGKIKLFFLNKIENIKNRQITRIQSSKGRN